MTNTKDVEANDALAISRRTILKLGTASAGLGFFMGRDSHGAGQSEFVAPAVPVPKSGSQAVSTVEIFFSGLLAFYYDKADGYVEVGVLNKAKGHGLKITGVVESSGGTLPIDLGTDLANTQIVFSGPAPATFNPGSLLTIDKKAPLTCKKKSLRPSIVVKTGAFNSAFEDYYSVTQPPSQNPQDKLITVTMKSTISLMTHQKVSLEVTNKTVDEEWFFPAKSGVNYRIFVTNLPPFFFHTMAGSASHFHLFYDLAFPGTKKTDRFDVAKAKHKPSRTPIGHRDPMRVVPEYPCIGVHLRQTPMQ
ncbi:MAG TPA: hypothetical protein VJS64_14565 [Pyrinomonadaceae bacterium]|nr:hypothetical protein [Pyrinomonadaceae bacterium]